MMVCVKQVGLIGDEVELLADGSGVAPDYLDSAPNEWDLCAIETALELREAGVASEVVAVSVGDEEIEPVLRQALAMGVDRAIRVDAPSVAPFDPLGTARAIVAAVGDESPDVVICGVQSSDGGQGGTAAALAALLDGPCLAVVRQLEWNGREFEVVRELEGGVLAVGVVAPPCVLSVQTGINQPRYTTFRQIKQASQRELDVRRVDAVVPGLTTLRVMTPDAGEGAEMLNGAPDAVARQIAMLIRERLP